MTDITPKTSSNSGQRPAEALQGLTVDGDWEIVSRMPTAADATGSTFSIPYIVERGPASNKERAFFKALDIARLLEIGVPIADAINNGTTAYIHERDLVLRCSQRRMSNVVKAVSAGEVNAPLDVIDPKYRVLAEVPYLIFECADGDIRAAIERNGKALDEAWSLKFLHGVANGIRQLHQEGISHQDLKPSNVMTFDDIAKVGDLGRATDGMVGSLWSGAAINGDMTYAPPELLYNEMQSDERVRRRACDLYHVGSMAVFLLTGAGLTALLNAELEEPFHWRNWRRSYRDVLPFVREAFDRALTTVAPLIRSPIGPDLQNLIREMCEPDPLRRGNPKRSDLGRYALDRYVSIFDRLSKSADVRLGKALR